VRQTETIRVVAIVGGHGEVEAVPALVKKLSKAKVLHSDISPLRFKEDQFLKFGREFKRFCSIAANKARQLNPQGRVLIFLDADDQARCPATVAPMVAKLFSEEHSDVEVLVCMMKREFETMFIYAADSIAGSIDLPSNLVPPPEPDSIRGAKEWLTKQMPRGQSYSETSHQKTLVEVADIEALLRCPSVARIHRHFSAWLG
jgi:hypothetical protein